MGVPGPTCVSRSLTLLSKQRNPSFPRTVDDDFAVVSLHDAFENRSALRHESRV